MKVLVVLGDGGHSAEMFKVLEQIGPKYEYAYMLSTVDSTSKDKIKWKGPTYAVTPPLQMKYRSVVDVIKSTFQQALVLFKAWPDAILSTGANIAIPISFFGKLTGVKIIHVESCCRVYTLSASGKVMYRLADLFFVQWEQLQKTYPKAIYRGRVM